MAFSAIALETRIFTVLKAIGLSATPIYHLLAPENALPPFVVFTRIATAFDSTLNSQSQFVIGLFQIDVWDSTPEAAATKAGSIRLALSGLREGTAVNQIAGAVCEGEFSGYEEQSKLYRRAMTFKVMMREDNS